MSDAQSIEDRIAGVIERNAGKSGDSEAETIVRWSKGGDVVHFWSCIGAHTANLLKRVAPESVLGLREDGTGVYVELDAKACRPPAMVAKHSGSKAAALKRLGGE